RQCSRSALLLRRPARLTPELSTLSLHDALPIFVLRRAVGGGGSVAEHASRRGHQDLPRRRHRGGTGGEGHQQRPHDVRPACRRRDRKSTRLNSSHVKISYAVFCLKKKMLAPADTPAEIVTKLRNAAVVALKDPKVVQAREQQGAAPSGNTPEAFAADIRRWQEQAA